MSKIFLLLSITLLFSQCKAEIYYFDPDYKGSSDGSEKQPFNNWSDIPWNDGSTYLIKRGSILRVDKTLRPDANNITIGVYGEGDRPKIISAQGSDGRIFDLGALKNIVISGLEVQSLNNAETCIHFFKSVNGTLEDCVFSGSQWGIRNALSSGNFKIRGCEVHNTADDGIFIKDVDSVEIINNFVHNVNTKYEINKSEKFSGGDCVQLVNVKYFIVRENKLDHSSSGNKFCFISSSTSPEIVPTGILENNHFVRNKESDDGDLVYFTGSGNVLVRNNIFEYGDHAIYNHSKNLNIFKNTFINQHTTAIYDEPRDVSETKVVNNTFVNQTCAVVCNSQQAIAMNNIFYEVKDAVFGGKGTVNSRNNCFYSHTMKKSASIDSTSIYEDPMFVNPAEKDFRLKPGSPCLGTGLAIEPGQKGTQKVRKSTAESNGNNIGAF